MTRSSRWFSKEHRNKHILSVLFQMMPVLLLTIGWPAYVWIVYVVFVVLVLGIALGVFFQAMSLGIERRNAVDSLPLWFDLLSGFMVLGMAVYRELYMLSGLVAYVVCMDSWWRVGYLVRRWMR